MQQLCFLHPRPLDHRVLMKAPCLDDCTVSTCWPSSQLRTHAALFPPLPGSGIHQRPCLVNGFQAAGGMPCLCPAGVLPSPYGLSCGLSPTWPYGLLPVSGHTPVPQYNVYITRSSALLNKSAYCTAQGRTAGPRPSHMPTPMVPTPKASNVTQKEKLRNRCCRSLLEALREIAIHSIFPC